MDLTFSSYRWCFVFRFILGTHTLGFLQFYLKSNRETLLVVNIKCFMRKKNPNSDNSQKKTVLFWLRFFHHLVTTQFYPGDLLLGIRSLDWEPLIWRKIQMKGWSHCLVFPPQGSAVSHFVLIAGEPIKEPVVQHGTSFVLFPLTSHWTKETLCFFQTSQIDPYQQYLEFNTSLCCICPSGPFVMTTEEEIREAIRDYQNGKNGFERAVNWRSKIRDSVWRLYIALLVKMFALHTFCYVKNVGVDNMLDC